MPPKLPSAVVCGSQTIPPPQECLEHIRFHLQNSHNLKGLFDAILDLPNLCSRLKERDPQLNQVSVTPIISLAHWVLDHNFTLEIPATLPNILLAPLTVLIHIVQYNQYLNHLALDDAHIHIREAVRDGGFQGLCTGSLSAAALVCSATRMDIGKNVAIAMRLAMCIGAYVDLDQMEMGDSKMTCFLARWGPECQREDVEEFLSHYPQAYISVELDETSATITTPEADMPSLRSYLLSKSIKIAKVQVNGRYHTKEHECVLQKLLELCESEPSLHFPQISNLSVPWRNNTTGRIVTTTNQLHEVCLQSLLTEPANWYLTMSETATSSASISSDEASTMLELGLVSCIPPSLAVSPHLTTIRASLSIDAGQEKMPSSPPKDVGYNYPEPCVAIVGGACKYPGAESLDELWNIISAEQAMYQNVPSNRYNSTSSWRHPAQAGDLTGNFVSDVDQFDYALFGISPREATYMDPQQRIALQVAYRAVESSGYFAHGMPTTDVGCYIGVGGSDYEHNVNSHAPTAFSFTGTSRAFASGRISHYFKWTGPSIAVDTACSSSAVAIHQACRDIVSGECTMALAGGVNIMSSPNTHQNLAAANFLNPTGPCRPFDSAANGYCRGEGCGLVMLKNLSVAMADGDYILGVIAATATNQSNGSSSITVPVSQSQASLYRRALSRAAMSPSDISYVEAHGTGTPRGDPIEYDSIHEVFGGIEKRNVHIGSIKANIGHTEAASGVAAVLKLLMMIQHGQIPPQANFTGLSAAILRQQPDNLVISTKTQRWNAGFRAACVNNYGASGNNTAIIVCQPPPTRTEETARPKLHWKRTLDRYPILISAQSEVSLQRYCAALGELIEKESPSLPDVAFNLAQRQNRNLRHRIAFDAKSLTELQNGFKYSDRPGVYSPTTGAKAKPVVLVFGGQMGSTVHLSKAVYDTSCLLRRQLDRCEAILKEMGLPSLFPSIFSQEPIDDIVSLHCLLFSVQYACAAAWLDAGLHVQRVIGHSFGQLTAMCISGVINLPDALRLVSGRAALIKHQWVNEKGCMLAIKIDRAGAHALIESETDLNLEVACYNGPNSHVLVGSETDIRIVASRASGMKMRTLNTTHGFHSRFIESFLDQYRDLARRISYSTPVIPIETCSETSSWEVFTPELVAEHSRRPVYFADAITRIEKQLGFCTWLDGGPGSNGVMLARDALNGSGSNSFHGLQIGSSDPMQSVVDTTLRLWSEGVSVQFWMYHSIEKPFFNPLTLPGYQFDETSHWLPCVERGPSKLASDTEQALISLANLSSPERHVFKFDINQSNPGITHVLQGREVQGGALWPLSLYIELAARAVGLLTPGLPLVFHRVRLVDLEIKAPLGSKAIPGLGLRLKQLEGWVWEWSLESHTGTYIMPHATGKVFLEDQRQTSNGPQGVFPKMIDYQHCRGFLDTAAAFSAPGKIAYKLLDKVAEYDTTYQSIRSINVSEDEATAQVDMPRAARDYARRTSCNPILMDQFTIVAEIHALTMASCKRSEIFACSGVREVAIFTSIQPEMRGPWTVYTRQSSKHHREIFYDTFVFDPATERLVSAVLGARFVKTSCHILQRVIERANLAETIAKPESEPEPVVKLERADAGQQCHLNSLLGAHLESQFSSGAWSTTAALVHELTGFPLEQISANTVLTEIGIDSLATTELENRIKETFKVDISVQIKDGGGEFGSLFDHIQSRRSLDQVTDMDDSNCPSQLTPSSNPSSLCSDAEAGNTTSDAMVKLLSVVTEYSGSAQTVHPETQLHSLGLDSLVALELESELLKTFGFKVNLARLDDTVTINDLHGLLIQCGLASIAKEPARPDSPFCAQEINRSVHFVDQAAARFNLVREEISLFAQNAEFAGFYERVFPKQTSLVLAYVVEAFAALGCDLGSIPPHTPVPIVPHIAKHNKAVAYYYNLLHEAGLISQTPNGSVRTSKPLERIGSSSLHREVVEKFPRHHSEHKLLHRTGSQLADCLSGKADALRLLFSDKATGDLLQDVYTNAPMFKMGTLMLGHFLPQALSLALPSATEPFRILELGAGTGGTTKYILDQLLARGVSLQYTFTDISAALVSRARKTFSAYDCIDYMTMDVEQIPPESIGSYDLILSSNCIHATKDLRQSCRAIFDLLRSKGMLCLLELTRDLPWLDCTFGLLDGWWRFEDGREHVLASEQLWKELLCNAGFIHVDWTNDKTSESDVFRLIMALKK